MEVTVGSSSIIGESASADVDRKRIRDAMVAAGIAASYNQRTGELTDNARVVLKRRYLSKDREGNILEDPDGMFRRVAHNLSESDLLYGVSSTERQETEQRFYEIMQRLEFLPNSPTLMNAGRELQQLSACFVLPVEDSLDSIFTKVKQTALIHKSGGGTGFAFSRLRPEGDVVGSTGGVASGPVSFINAFDAATDVVKQGGTRRGANMGILHVTHPDIMAFITAKADGQRLSNFNISVAVTEDFMQKVQNGEDYDLVNPRTGAIVGQLDARDVFTSMTELAWRTGDPGIVFLDRINRDNPNPQLGDIESTNPCFAGEVRLATDRGLLTFEELFLGQSRISVLTDNRAAALRQVEYGGGVGVAVDAKVGVALRPAVPVFRTRKDWPVFRLETVHGFEVIATEDHKFFTPEGPKELHELNLGDEILIQSGKGAWNQDDSLPPFAPANKLKARIERGEAKLPQKWSRELGELLGWVIGDGWVSHEIPRHRHLPNSTVGLMFGSEEKKILAPKFQALIKEWLGMDGARIERHGTLTLYYKSALYHFLESLGIAESDGLKKTVPASIWNAPRQAVLGFLSALFTADGTVNVSSHKASCSIRLANSSKQLLKEVQLLLLNEGMVSKLYHRRASGAKLMPDSHRQPKLYSCSDQYELVMDGQSRDRFLAEIGFLIPTKQDKANAWLQTKQRKSNQDSFTDRVQSITYCGNTDVYCTTEPETHSIVANGFVTAQCGEQPLLPYESCNLGSLNLARMVRYTDDDVEMDWQRVAEVITAAVHMLDCVIDMNHYPIPEIAEMSLKTRRIGLGVMGWSDLLIQLGVRYDSEEALELAKEVMRRIQQETYRASGELATRRGVFPEWEFSVYNDGPGSQPMRNSAPVTIAPTGTISIIAGASSGIEPLFALSYVRNVMDNTRLVEGNAYFEAVARHEGFYSPELMEQLAASGSLDDLAVPGWVKNVFRVSHDINPQWHVRMQAAFQTYTDNAVSKTINFPHDATVDDVAEAYRAAYDLGCKGITVYRDGSKSEQVLSTGATSGTQAGEALDVRTIEVPGPRVPRERPRRTQGITERVRTGHGNMYVTVNLDENNSPFEVFGTMGKAGGCDAALLEAVSRLVSLALRAGIETEEVTRQLRGITCCPAWDDGTLVRSGPDAVAIVLERITQEPGTGHGGADGVQLTLPSGAPGYGSDGPEVRPWMPQQQTLGGSATPAGETNGNGSNGVHDVPGTYTRRCPECNGAAVSQEGCLTCFFCGWTKCE